MCPCCAEDPHIYYYSLTNLAACYILGTDRATEMKEFLSHPSGGPQANGKSSHKNQHRKVILSFKGLK